MANYERQRRKENRKKQFLAMAGLIGTFGAGAFTSLKQTKIEATMSAEELHQVNVLVEQGLYSSREAFLQSAARNMLHEHGMDLPQVATGQLRQRALLYTTARAWKNFLPLGGRLNST
jgi:Arc/MetJ-type ribon-helix-helix transcriptional regulator